MCFLSAILNIKMAEWSMDWTFDPSTLCSYEHLPWVIQGAPRGFSLFASGSTKGPLKNQLPTELWPVFILSCHSSYDTDMFAEIIFHLVFRLVPSSSHVFNPWRRNFGCGFVTNSSNGFALAALALHCTREIKHFLWDGFDDCTTAVWYFSSWLWSPKKCYSYFYVIV